MENRIKKALVYYTDNHCPEYIVFACRRQLEKCMEIYKFPIISVSQMPIKFGKNIVMDLPRSVLSIYKQTIKGLEESNADVVFLVEHDLLYHPSHFDITPSKKDVFCFDMNRWFVQTDTGKAFTYAVSDESLMCGYRELLLKHFRKAAEVTERNGFDRSLGFTPPKGVPKEDRCGGVENYTAKCPTIHINFSGNFTHKRSNKSEFRSESSCPGWTEADEIPHWGKTLGRFNEFLREVRNDTTL